MYGSVGRPLVEPGLLLSALCAEEKVSNNSSVTFYTESAINPNSGEVNMRRVNDRFYVPYSTLYTLCSMLFSHPTCATLECRKCKDKSLKLFGDTVIQMHIRT